jgi:hypothetical protein
MMGWFIARVEDPDPAVHEAATGRAMTLLLKLAAIGSPLLLGLSVYPGVLVDILFLGVLFSPLWLPALVIGRVIFRDHIVREAE